MEIWKDIKGYEGYYQISNLGRVKSLARTYICGNYNSVMVTKDKILKASLALGYPQVGLLINGVRKAFKVHRLVCMHFIDNPENKLCINHINGIKSDNRLENLEWVTNSENSLHAFRTGLNVARKGDKSHFFGIKGELSPRVKIILNKVTGIFYYGVREAAEAHGIHYGSLKCYLNGSAPNKTNLSYV